MLGWLPRFICWPKQQVNFVASSELEELWLKSPQRGDSDKSFVRAFQHSEIFVLQQESSGSSAFPSFRSLQKGYDSYLYAYTSESIYHWCTLKKQVRPGYLGQIPVQHLLEALPPRQGLLVNFGHPQGWVIAPDHKGIWLGQEQTSSRQAQESIQIGRPQELPPDFLHSLSEFRNQCQLLAEAFFGLIKRGDAHPEFLYLLRYRHNIGNHDKTSIKRELFALVKKCFIHETPVNFIEVWEEGNFPHWTSKEVLLSF